MYDVGRCLLSDKLLEARMTQQELADRIGVKKQQINSYTTDTNVMSLLIAKNIASVMRCEIGELYEWKKVVNRTKMRQ